MFQLLYSLYKKFGQDQTLIAYRVESSSDSSASSPRLIDVSVSAAAHSESLATSGNTTGSSIQTGTSCSESFSGAVNISVEELFAPIGRGGGPSVSQEPEILARLKGERTHLLLEIERVKGLLSSSNEPLTDEEEAMLAVLLED